MTVLLEVDSEQYPGNGVADEFDFRFLIFDSSELLVRLIEDATGVAQILGIGLDYTIAVSATGGTVTMTDPPANGYTLDLRPVYEILQPTSIKNQGTFRPEVHEQALDRLAAQQIYLRRLIARCFQLPDYGDESAINTLGIRSARANKFWSFDANGDLFLADGVADLGAIPVPVPLVSGGTGASTRGNALVNLGLIDMANPVSVTGAIALDASALGRVLVLSDPGSPANYTVSLPSGAPVGAMIMVRVSQAATKLYTIAGVDVGLDGQANRVMWRGESALLVREAANWAKVGGITIPFRGVLTRESVQNITAGATWVKAALTDERGDAYDLDLCFDAVNGRFKAPRMGSFSFAGYLSIAATVATSAADADITISRNGAGFATAAPATLMRLSYPVGGTRQILTVSGLAYACNKDDYVELLGRISGAAVSSAQFQYTASQLETSLSYIETPVW